MKLEDLEYPFWLNRDVAGASPQQIRQFERDAGFKLLEEFRRALILRNGGVSSYSLYRRRRYSASVPAFFNIDELRMAEKYREDYGTPRGILVIAGGGHEWLGLDYRQGPDPRIVFQEDEDSPIEIVAEDFESFLGGLVLE